MNSLLETFEERFDRTMLISNNSFPRLTKEKCNLHDWYAILITLLHPPFRADPAVIRQTNLSQ